MTSLLLSVAIGASLLQMHVQERRDARIATKQAPAAYRIGREILPNASSPRRRNIVQRVTVTEVIDGSIITVRQSDSTLQEVRLLGVEAPELLSETNECYGKEAHDALRTLLLGQTVTLERDPEYQRDSYRRLVRYVRLGSQDVNAWMLWHGYAFSDTLTHTHKTDYDSLQDQAKEAERGLWSYRCDYNNNVKTVPVLQ